MNVHITHLYPDLMDLYGSRANVLVLTRYLKELGCTVTVEYAAPGQQSVSMGADFFYMGAGTERSQRAAMEDLSHYSRALRSAAEDGAVMFFAGTAMELLGQSIQEPDGSVYAGIGLAGFSTKHERRRTVGDVYGHTDLYPEPVVGYMNKCGTIRDVETPLLTKLQLGSGNRGEGSPEGFHWKNVFASELTGPLLVKNPKLLETVAAAIFARKGASLPAERPSDPWREAAYAVTEEELRGRLER